MNSHMPSAAISLSGRRRQVTLVRIRMAGFDDTRAFDDIVELLCAAFEELGWDVRVSTNACAAEGFNIIVGANVLGRMAETDRPQLPPNSIVWNLEQVARDNPRMSAHYVKLLRMFPVWDYSAKNIERLKRDFAVDHAVLLRLGHMPRMRRIARAEQDIDVLFYGHISARRQRILSALNDASLRVETLTDCFGAERDAFIARAKVVLNLHYFNFVGVNELVRLSYLLSNAKAVVSEASPATAIEPDVMACCAAVPYAGLVDACIALVRDDDARRALEARAFAIFSNRDQREFLRAALSDSCLAAKSLSPLLLQ